MKRAMSSVIICMFAVLNITVLELQQKLSYSIERMTERYTKAVVEPVIR